MAHYILATEHVLRELLPFATDVVLRETAITTRTLSAHDFVDALVAEFAAVLQSDAVPELADALRSAPTAGANGYTTVDDALWLEHVVRGPILERTADRLVRAVYWRIVYYETALGTLVAAEDRERTIAALRRLLVGSPYIVDWLTKSAKACQPLRAWVEAASDPDATEAQRQEARTLALQGRECGTFSLGTRLLSTTKVYGTGEAGVPFELFFLRTGGLPSSPEHIRTTDTAFAHAFDVTWSSTSRPHPRARSADSPLPEVAEWSLWGCRIRCSRRGSVEGTRGKKKGRDASPSVNQNKMTRIAVSVTRRPVHRYTRMPVLAKRESVVDAAFEKYYDARARAAPAPATGAVELGWDGVAIINDFMEAPLYLFEFWTADGKDWHKCFTYRNMTKFSETGEKS